MEEKRNNTLYLSLTDEEVKIIDNVILDLKNRLPYFKANRQDIIRIAINELPKIKL